MTIRALAAVGIAVFTSGGLFAQSEAARLAFEVASVKPADPDSRRGLDFRTAPGGSLTVTNLTLQALIQEAFGVKRYQIAGGPKWMDSDRFDIAAKAAGDPDRKQMMAMLRTLLEDRFQMNVGWETREGNVYALVVAKNGPKLKEPTSGDQSFIRLARYDPPERPTLTYVLYGQKTSMPLLVENLAGQLSTPVFDSTGIKRNFDFRLEFVYDDTQPDSGPSILGAIQDQLGLKLEPAKGPVETLVIERAGKPSGN
jgi:uncharacterized protein (TIGR03435 family)